MQAVVFSNVHVIYEHAFTTEAGVATRIKDDEFDLNSANTFYTTTIDNFIKRHITHNGAYTAGAVAGVVPGRLADLAAADEQ